jgi:hypothetical protein
MSRGHFEAVIPHYNYQPTVRIFASSAGLDLCHFSCSASRGTSQPNDLIVVQLDEKSDHRESRMATGNMFGAGHGGFDPKRTVKMLVRGPNQVPVGQGCASCSEKTF